MSDQIEHLLQGILIGVNRIAGAYEKMLELQLAKKGAPAAPKEAARVDHAESTKEVLTVTDFILHFGVATDSSGNVAVTKKGKNPGNSYWDLKLMNGFGAKVFSESQAKTCQAAADEGLQLIVDYEVSGKYNNINSVRIAPRRAQQQAAEKAASGDRTAPF